MRRIRGGSSPNFDLASVTWRDHFEPSVRDYELGFRLVLSRERGLLGKVNLRRADKARPPV